MKLTPALILAAALSPFCSAQAYEVTLTFTNQSAANGAALSPIFIALGNGSFNPFTAGGMASTAIQTLSETGSGSGLATLFTAADPAGYSQEVTATTNSFGPGIYLPGGTASVTLNLDPTLNEYLNYYSMVVPSNDFFVGGQIQLFDSSGNFLGANATLTGGSVWDAGAVVPQIAGAAFLSGNSGTSNTAESGVIAAINATNSSANSYEVYAGQQTAAGYTFSDLPNSATPLLSISAVSAVPVPAAVWLFGSVLPMLGLARRKRLAV
ncbi:MAG: spondin domain-containing protein [Methylococcales bacterium]|nr:spondin domain-containing protein [Methylococcales bacterium]